MLVAAKQRTDQEEQIIPTNYISIISMNSLGRHGTWFTSRIQERVDVKCLKWRCKRGVVYQVLCKWGVLQSEGAADSPQQQRRVEAAAPGFIREKNKLCKYGGQTSVKLCRSPWRRRWGWMKPMTTYPSDHRTQQRTHRADFVINFRASEILKKLQRSFQLVYTQCLPPPLVVKILIYCWSNWSELMNMFQMCVKEELKVFCLQNSESPKKDPWCVFVSVYFRMNIWTN